MMNKIKVSNQEISFLEEDKKIEITYVKRTSTFDIPKLQIIILEDTDLEIDYIENLDKLEIEIHVNKSAHSNILEIRKNNQLKVQYKYYLEEYSELNIQKFYLCNKIKELDIVYLDGENAKINYILKTVAKDTQRYDVFVYHNNANTTSNIKHHGVTLKNGNITLNVTGSVYEGIKNCELNQNNRILSFNQKKSIIQPILLIEDKDIIANHSAYIGNVDKEALFYLMSRGIAFKDATILLAKGFLLEGIKQNEMISNLIDECWR